MDRNLSDSDPSAKSNIRLILRFQNQICEVFPEQCPIHLGRGARNQIALPDIEIAASRQHASINFDNDHFTITDTSSNGTFLITDSEEKELKHQSAYLQGSGILGLGKKTSMRDAMAIYFVVKSSGERSSVVIRGEDLQNEEPLFLERSPLRLLMDSPLSDEMTFNEAKVLAEIVELRQLFSGEPLTTEHSLDATLYCIVSGSLSVSAETENTVGKSSLHLLEAGDLAGEFGFVEDVQRTATLRAVGETEVICLSRNKFNEVVQIYPMIGYKLLRTLVRSIRFLLLRMNVQYMDMETAFRRQLRRQKQSGSNVGEMTMIR
ncbi:MAG: cyclic nucleotide-binding domain-containing protein [Magnetococcales bacterium]|nr:cyclic nucleotide-binding domain-containing protein [Magnetococcales bacterium]NGZ29352.1 cyclic nucleotide-binding domain-containing protein [Magnetococcales bacterium]